MSNNAETKTEPVRPNLLGAPARHCLRLLPRFTSRTPSGVPSDPSDLPPSASAPPVKGLLRLPNKTRKQFFGEIAKKFKLPLKVLLLNDFIIRPRAIRGRGETVTQGNLALPRARTTAPVIQCPFSFRYSPTCQTRSAPGSCPRRQMRVRRR